MFLMYLQVELIIRAQSRSRLLTQAVLYADGLFGTQENLFAIVGGLELDTFLCDLREFNEGHHLEPSTVLWEEGGETQDNRTHTHIGSSVCFCECAKSHMHYPLITLYT